MSLETTVSQQWQQGHRSVQQEPLPIPSFGWLTPSRRMADPPAGAPSSRSSCMNNSMARCFRLKPTSARGCAAFHRRILQLFFILSNTECILLLCSVSLHGHMGATVEARAQDRQPTTPPAPRAQAARPPRCLQHAPPARWPSRGRARKPSGASPAARRAEVPGARGHASAAH